MTLFNITKPIEESVELSAEDAQAIYDALKAGKNETDLFKEGISFAKSALVLAEIKSLEAEVISKMSGSYLLEAAIKNDEGEITTPAVYFAVTTEAALKDSMSSDLLDIDTVVTDVRIYSDNNPDVAPDWDTYKESFGGE